jgi:hypothetical protein
LRRKKIACIHTPDTFCWPNPDGWSKQKDNTW